jgi:hypothetical protein
MKRIIFTVLLSAVTVSLFAPLISRDLAKDQKQFFAAQMTMSALMLMRCFSYIESGGDYTKQGASGEYGKYQIMPGTWRNLCNEFFGHLVPMTPNNQDFIVRAKIIQWLKMGLTRLQIASLWNCGLTDYTQMKGKGIGKNSKGVSYNVPEYIETFDSTYLTLKN